MRPEYIYHFMQKTSTPVRKVAVYDRVASKSGMTNGMRGFTAEFAVNFCKEWGYELVPSSTGPTFLDLSSGGSDYRPQFDAALKSGADTLMFMYQDRFADEAGVAHTLLQRAADAGVNLISCDEISRQRMLLLSLALNLGSVEVCSGDPPLA